MLTPRGNGRPTASDGLRLYIVVDVCRDFGSCRQLAARASAEHSYNRKLAPVLAELVAPALAFV